MSVVVRTKKFVTNKLLSRKQMVIEVLHPNLPSVSKEKLREIIAKKYKVDDKNVVVFGMKIAFGGGKSTGFCFIYDNHQYFLKFEPRHRLVAREIITKKTVTRKTKKEVKSKCKKIRGKGKNEVKKGKTYGPADFKKQKDVYFGKFLAGK